MVIIRYDTGPEGTPGTLILRDWRTYRVIELPWKDNARDVSCIPAGGPYALRVRPAAESRRFSYDHVAVDDVPERSNILFHGGNWGGSEADGFACELLGCIAPGLAPQHRRVNGALQPGVASSRAALARVVEAVAAGDDRLWIGWAREASGDDLVKALGTPG